MFLFVGPSPGPFPVSGFLSTEGFESSYFCTYSSNEQFLVDGGYSERVPPASNAQRCGVLAAEAKATASSHQQPTTTRNCAACRVLTFDASTIQRKNSIHNKAANQHMLCVLHPQSNPHLLYCLFQLDLHGAFFLYCLCLSGPPKRAHFRRCNFLNQSRALCFHQALTNTVLRSWLVITQFQCMIVFFGVVFQLILILRSQFLEELRFFF